MIRNIFVIVILTFMLGAGLTGLDAHASEKYSIKQMTPAIQSALENRRDRYDDLKDLKQQGHIGENNQGYLTAFSSQSNVQRTVDVENQDRKIIYEAIAQQNNIADAINLVHEAFAAIQRQNAEPGDKIQLENGQWSTK